MKDYLYRLAADYLLDDQIKAQRASLREGVLFWFGIACLVGLLVVATRAHALQLSGQECQGYAVWTHDVVLMRDVGADKEKVRAYLQSKADEIPYFARLLKEFDRLWATQSGRVEEGNAVIQDCYKRRGNYGVDV